ncbi:MAG: flagellar basal body rod protein FlgC [Tepidisphaerales bacterium]
MSLFDVMNIAASGMQAAQTQLSVSANNIANADTPGFKASRVDTVELGTGGVGTVITRDNSAGAANPDGSEGSNVDLAAEQVAMARDATYYAANATVVKVANRMLGSLLDIFDTEDRHGHRHHHV